MATFDPSHIQYIQQQMKRNTIQEKREDARHKFDKSTLFKLIKIMICIELLYRVTNWAIDEYAYDKYYVLMFQRYTHRIANYIYYWNREIGKMLVAVIVTFLRALLNLLKN